MGDSHDRWPARPALAWILSSILLATSLALAVPAHGKAAPVALGNVTTKIKRPKVDLSTAFRSEIVRQLRTIELQDVPDAQRVVLSASLTQLETQRRGNRAQSSCVVSATLHKAKGGALVAILRGKARAEDDIDEETSNEMAVMRAAVRSAVRGIPQALR